VEDEDESASHHSREASHDSDVVFPEDSEETVPSCKHQDSPAPTAHHTDDQNTASSSHSEGVGAPSPAADEESFKPNEKGGREAASGQSTPEFHDSDHGTSVLLVGGKSICSCSYR
jgi:hypothetical protein